MALKSTPKLTDTSTMTFGKRHKGKTMANVPADYLLFIDKSCPEDVQEYINENRQLLHEEVRRAARARKTGDNDR